MLTAFAVFVGVVAGFLIGHSLKIHRAISGDLKKLCRRHAKEAKEFDEMKAEWYRVKEGDIAESTEPRQPWRMERVKIRGVEDLEDTNGIPTRRREGRKKTV